MSKTRNHPIRPVRSWRRMVTGLLAAILVVLLAFMVWVNINHLRIEEAKRLLLSTNATISEVASAVGYDNISYFSTVFRKICGMSPLEWCGGKREEGRP